MRITKYFSLVIELLFFFEIVIKEENITISTIVYMGLVCIYLVGTELFKRYVSFQIKSQIAWMLFKLFFSFIHVIGYRISAYERIIGIKTFFFIIGMYIFIDAMFGIIIHVYLYMKQIYMRKKRCTNGSIYTFFCVFAIDFIVLLVLYPGLITYDTETQLLMAAGLEKLTDHHPVFLTILLRGIIITGRQLGNYNIGVFLTLLLQVFLFAVVIAYSVDVVRTVNTDNFAVCVLKWFYALNPLFILYSITLGKDSLVAVLFLLYLASLIECLFVKCDLTNRLMVQIVISVILSCLIRHNSLYAFLFSLPLLFINLKKKRVIVMCTFIILFLFGVRWLYYDYFWIEKTSDAEKYSLIFQTTAQMLIDHGLDLDENELSIINDFMGSKDDIVAAYDPQISDPIKNTLYNEGISSSEKKAFFIQWIFLFFKYPASYLKALYYQTYGYFNMDFLNGVKARFFVHETGWLFEYLTETGLPFSGSRFISNVDSVIMFLERVPVLGYITRIGLYSWMLLFPLLNDLLTKRGKMLVIITPVLIYFITILAGPVNGYYRYMIPVAFCAPMVFTMYIKDQQKLKNL